MRNNWTIIVAVVLAIVTATAAIALRPVRLAKDIEPLETTETVSVTLTISETETESVTESTESTTRANLPSATEKRTTATTEASTTKKQSKLVSKLHEVAEKDREWLSKREKTTTQAYSMTPAEFRKAGKIYYNGYYYTWYSEKRLPGPDLHIPGRHSDGNFVRDGEEYIVLASSDLPKGTVVDTPFGKGKVYDTGCMSGVIDVYVSW